MTHRVPDMGKAKNIIYIHCDVMTTIQCTQAQCLLSTLFILTLTIRELYHYSSIAVMLLQSHCGDEEDRRIGLSSSCHNKYIYIMLFDLCMLNDHEPISVLIIIFMLLLVQCYLSTLLLLTLTVCELCHWPSEAGMSPQNHCGEEKEVRSGLCY